MSNIDGTNLNKATNGLLDGTYPWQGQGANSFSDTWQTFGNSIQLLQKTCEDTHNSLTNFSKRYIQLLVQIYGNKPIPADIRKRRC